MPNLADLLTASAARWPGRPAIQDRELALTHAELLEASLRVAGSLRARGIRPGDRVGLMLPNEFAFPPFYYGILACGAIVVPMNPLLKAREIAFYLRSTEAKLLVAPVAAQPTLAPVLSGLPVPVWYMGDDLADCLAGQDPMPGIEERDGEDTAVILFTSGTTGRPKGAELTHDNLTRNALASARLFGLTEQDVLFAGLPLFHSFGQTCVLNAAVAAGAQVVLQGRFDAREALRLLGAHQITVLAGVPTMWVQLLAAVESSLPLRSRPRIALSGGASLPGEVLRRFESAFGCDVLEGYGLSETSPVVSFNHRDQPRKVGSVGTPIAGVHLRLVGDQGEPARLGEVGEITVRGHNVMKGYWRDPVATGEAIQDGWFHTGDLGRQDEDGYLRIVGRKKEVIIRGGMNVYPREVENVLHEHPAVREAVVLGLPNPELGEEVSAVVVPRAGVSITAEELRSFVKEQLAPYKYPRQVRIVSELPKGATGKVLRREILDALTADQSG